MSKPSGTQARQAANDARSSGAVRTLARAGYAANGLVHLLIGAIAVGVAQGGGGQADQGGALAAVAGTPGGTVVLWACALGLFGLALWSLLAAVLAPQRESTAKTWGTRLKELGKAVVYGALGATALTYALGGSSDSSSSSQSMSAKVLAAPGGVALLVIAGLAVLVIGGVFVYRGVSRTCLENVAVPGGTLGTVVTWLGIAGYTAKGIVLGAFGVLLIVAALTADPEKAGGLDAALKSLVELPAGVVLLLFVAIGLIAYGLFCFARAKWPGKL